MPIFRKSPVRIQPYFGYRNTQRLVVSGRALASGKASFDKQGRFQAMRTMIAQFASREVAGVAVELELRGPDGTRLRHAGTTDKEGYVRFDVALEGDWSLTEHPEWETVLLHWTNENGAQCVEGHVLAPGSATDLAVISDIDDTIIETGITGFRQVLRNWQRVLATLPESRVAVPGADAFYGALGGQSVVPGEEHAAGEHEAAAHRPFFYVSSSPWNLFSYLVAFKKQRGLPLGPIFLRDWGLNRETFGSSSHGSHKTDAIRTILAAYPDMRFALIGDDTQGDLPAFGAIVTENAERIAAVFIRTTQETFSPEEEAAREAIAKAGVPLWLGSDYKTGEKFLATAGLAGSGEATQIVATVEGEEEGAKLWQAKGETTGTMASGKGGESA